MKWILRIIDQKHMIRKSVILRILYFLSPFVIVIIVCFIGFLVNKNKFNVDTTTVSYMLAAISLPGFFILGLLDILVRFVLKQNTIKIWLVEFLIIIVLVAIIFY